MSNQNEPRVTLPARIDDLIKAVCTAHKAHLLTSEEFSRFDATYLRSWEGDEPITRAERAARDKIEYERRQRVIAMTQTQVTLLGATARLAEAYEKLDIPF